MFGMSGTELAIVLVLALLLLGPAKLPELARSLGKAVRDFKRTTSDIRTSVESEFYKMDEAELGHRNAPRPPAAPVPPTPAAAGNTLPASAPVSAPASTVAQAKAEPPVEIESPRSRSGKPAAGTPEGGPGDGAA